LLRLAEGDPLEIGARCDEHLREQALLLEPARLHLRAMARTAYAAFGYSGVPKLDEWLASCIRNSARELLDEDLEEQRAGIPAQDGPAAREGFLHGLLGMEPTLARAASVEFNRLPAEVRRIGWDVLVERRTLDECVGNGSGSRAAVQASLRQVLQALGRTGESCDPAGGEDG
jgi:hypothetical protein